MEIQELNDPAASRLGFSPKEIKRWIMNRTGSPTFVGQVLAIDLRSSATESGSEYSPAKSELGVWGNGVLPAGSDLTSGICGLVQSVVADDKPVEVILQGFGTGFVLRQAGSGTVNPGDVLVVDVAGKLDATTAAGEKFFAKFQADAATIDGTGAAVHRVLFDGLTGFGNA